MTLNRLNGSKKHQSRTGFKSPAFKQKRLSPEESEKPIVRLIAWGKTKKGTARLFLFSLLSI
jgi:hypothetical protein